MIRCSIWQELRFKFIEIFIFKMNTVKQQFIFLTVFPSIYECICWPQWQHYIFHFCVGVFNITKKGDMMEWHEKSTLNYWKNVSRNTCNKVSGKDPGDLPLDIHRGDNFTAFIGQLCRKVTFNYLKEVSLLLTSKLFLVTAFRYPK